MTNKTTTEIKNFLKDLQETTKIDLSDNLQNCFYDNELEDLDQNNPSDCFNDLYDMLDEKGHFNIEIIYYSRAIEYLSNNDASLSRSLELASDLGFTTENLSSEILASLLASEQAREQFGELREEIISFFEEE